MIVKQQFSTDIYSMGVGIQKDFMASSMKPCVLADHTEQLCGLCHSPVVCGIEMHLSHMQGLISAVNIPGGTVIKPQSCLLAGEIRNAAVLCRIVSSAGKAAGFIRKQSIFQTETPLFRLQAKGFKYISRNLHCLHPPCDPLEDAGLQDHFRVLGVYLVCQFLRQAKMLLVIHRHVPDARCSSKKFYAHLPDCPQIIFQCFTLI